MPKLSALKLVDEALLPAVLVIASKILAAFVFSIFLGVPWGFTHQVSTSYNLLFISFNTQADLYLINSLSDLVMILVAGLGFVWIVFRSSYFSESSLHPLLSAKLHKTGKEHLIMSDHEVFHQAAVWLSLSWFTFFTVIADVAAGTCNEFNLGIVLIITIGLTLTLWDKLRNLKH